MTVPIMINENVIKEVIDNCRRSKDKPPPCSGYLTAEQEDAYARGWREALQATAWILEHVLTRMKEVRE